MHERAGALDRPRVRDEIALDEDRELAPEADHVAVHHADALRPHAADEGAVGGAEILQVAAVRSHADPQVLGRDAGALDPRLP